MPDLHVTAVSRTQGNNATVKDGSIRPAACVLDFEEVPVLVHAFRRMVRELAYDISEMALTTYLCARAHGTAFTALPVFLVRGLHHGAIVTSAVNGVTHPSELAGRRVGVNRGYTVTTGVWARAILQEEHGLDLDAVTWVLSGDEHVAAYKPPPNVVPVDPGRDLAEMVASGELAAGIGIKSEDPDLVPLIPEPEVAGLRAAVDRGVFPINHLLVVRDDVLEAHPGLAADVFDTFARAKRDYVDALRAGTIDAPTATDQMYRKVMQGTGEDPLPYGLAPNRDILERLLGHAVDQHILDRAVALDGLFAAGSRDLTG